MLNFKQVNILDWIEVSTLPEAIDVGSPVTTNSRFYNTALWTLNPCRVVSVHNNAGENGSKESHILYATLKGHLLAGEEIFRVRLQSKVDHSSRLSYSNSFAYLLIYIDRRKRCSLRWSLSRVGLARLAGSVCHSFDRCRTDFSSRTSKACGSSWLLRDHLLRPIDSWRLTLLCVRLSLLLW
jgi:hypothetical protein